MALADAELANGHLDAGASAAARALELAPELADAHLTMGLVALRRRRPADAEAHFRAALARNPESARAMNNLGVALLRQHRRRQAIHCFAEASRLDPTFSTPRRNAVVAARAGAATIGLGLGVYAILLHHPFWLPVLAVAALLVAVRARTASGRRGRVTAPADEPKASLRLIRLLLREGPTRRGRARAALPFVGAVVLLEGAVFLFAGWLSLEGRHPVVGGVIVVAGLASLAGGIYLLLRVVRANQRRRALRRYV